MTDFQRMVVIPQDEYLSMTTSSSLQQVKEPLQDQFHKVEKQHQEGDKIGDPYRRLVMQSTSLDQLKSLKEKIRNSLVVATPKPYRNRAQALFQSIDSVIRFNDKGEIYTKDNEVIPGSRVEDLINHAIRDRRRNIIPIGWSSFLSYLREHNIPKSILNRSTLDELEGVLTPEIKQETSPKIKTPESRSREVSASRPIAERVARTKRRRKRPREVSPLRPPQRAVKKAALDFLKNYSHE